MANSQSTLPEGTDSIVPGAMMDEPAAGDYAGAPSYGAASSGAGAGGASSSSSSIGSSASSGAREQFGEAAAHAGDAAMGLRAQAADKARSYALQGKDRAVDALDNVTRLVDEAAATIDEKLGDQYGAYARRASEAVAGLADTLREKEVEELLDDARDVVRKSPAIAIGAAAALGFVVARLIRASVPDTATDTTDAAGSPTQAPTPTPSTATTVPADPSL